MEELLNEKIREAEQCEDLDMSEEYLTGYINGLKMAKQLLKEEGVIKSVHI